MASSFARLRHEFAGHCCRGARGALDALAPRPCLASPQPETRTGGDTARRRSRTRQAVAASEAVVALSSASPLPERASPSSHRIPACHAAAGHLLVSHPSNRFFTVDGGI